MDVFGLPLHPLVVHAAVMLVPMAALGALLVVASARLRDRYGWLVAILAAAGAGAAITARLTGEALAAQLGVGDLVATHRSFGTLVPYPAVALALSLPAALLLKPRSRTAWLVAAGLSLVAALAGLVLIVLTGHSGAVAVWGS